MIISIFNIAVVVSLYFGIDKLLKFVIHIFLLNVIYCRCVIAIFNVDVLLNIVIIANKLFHDIAFNACITESTYFHFLYLTLKIEREERAYQTHDTWSTNENSFMVMHEVWIHQFVQKINSRWPKI